MSDDVLMTTSFEEGALAFEDLARVHAVTRRDWRTALAAAERGRAMSLRTSTGDTALTLDADLRRLPEGLVVLYYVTLDDRLLAFALSRTGQRFAEVPISRVELARTIGSLTARPIGSGSGVAGDVLRRLHQVLVAPLSAAVPAGSALAVVPDGPLHQVPFGALIGDDGKYVIERHAVVVAPSLHALLTVTAASTPSRRSLGQALIVAPSGVSDGARRMPDLPHARAEAEAIARLYDKASVLVSEAATRAAFTARAGEVDVVHFAGHAVANQRYPLLSKLLFSPVGDGPHALTSVDLGRLAFPGTRVVTLAACEAVAGRPIRGEGVLSLARPWLRAGVPSVVASLWEIDDANARRLFTRLHELLVEGMHPVIALQRVQVEAARDRSMAFRDWAGLTVFGAAPT